MIVRPSFVFLREDGESNSAAVARCALQATSPGPMSRSVRAEDYKSFLEAGFAVDTPTAPVFNSGGTHCAIFVRCCFACAGVKPRGRRPTVTGITSWLGVGWLFGHAAFNTINIQQGGDVRFSGGPSAFQAARLNINLYGMSDYNVDVAFYDVSTAAPVTIGESSVFSGAGSTNSQLWGINNTGAFYGVNVNAGGRLTWRNPPTITSGSGDVLVGGTAQTWAAITALAQSSYLNPNNSAVAGLRQV